MTSPGTVPVVRVFGERRFHADTDLAAVAFGRDGSLWTVEESGQLRQWQPDSGRLQHSCFLSDLETAWAFSPDASRLASASDDVSLWDCATGQALARLPQSGWITAVALSPDARRVASGHDDNTVRVWDPATGQRVRELCGHELPPSALAFSPDGCCLASAGEDRLIHLWDLDSGRLLGTMSGHTDRIPALVWHPGGRLLISAGWDTTARVWAVQNCEPVILLNSHADQVTALALSHDGATLACADSAFAIHIWDTTSWTTRHILRGHTEEIRSLAFNPDGRRLASAGSDRVLHLWDPRQGQPLGGMDGQARHTVSLTAHDRSLLLASNRGGADGEVWDPERAGLVWSSSTARPVQAVACSPDGRWVAAAETNGPIRFYEAASGTAGPTLEAPTHQPGVLAFSPDSALLAVGSPWDGTVWFWDVAKREPTLIIPEAADGCSVETLAFHPQGRWLACGGIDWLATGGSDGAVCVWDVAEGRQIALLAGGTRSVAFAPTGRRLAVASLGEAIRIWNVVNWLPVNELRGAEEGIAGIAYSPDGRWLAAGSPDGVVRLWNPTAGIVAVQLELDTPLEMLAFSPDGRWLFAANGNTTMSRLDLRQLV